jgi:hypothetical protein
VPLTGTAGVATQVPIFVGFPEGVTSGTYDHDFDTSSASFYNPAFITANGSVAAAELAFFAGLTEFRAYFNIHTTAFPSGEIRGFLTPVPAALPLLASAVGGLALIGYRRRAQRLVVES